MTAVLPAAACGVTGVELTEEQNSQIVEYAAGLLLKYDANHHGRLVEEKEEDEEVQQPPAEDLAPVEEKEEEITPEDVEEPEMTDAVEEQEEEVERTIEEFYSIEGAVISYTGYEIKDSYPDSGGDDLFFAMNASTGCKLLIINFDVVNTGGGDLSIDMVSKESKFRVSINGAMPKYALTTMLMNDLASYIGTIPSGSSENLVLVCEIPEEEADLVETISLLMRNGSEEGRLTLN